MILDETHETLDCVDDLYAYKTSSVSHSCYQETAIQIVVHHVPFTVSIYLAICSGLVASDESSSFETDPLLRYGPFSSRPQLVNTIESDLRGGQVLGSQDPQQI